MTLIKKSLIAAAVASVCTIGAGAHSQQNVTVTLEPHLSIEENYEAIRDQAKQACRSALRKMKTASVAKCTDQIVENAIVAIDNHELTAFHESPTEARQTFMIASSDKN